MKKSYDIIIIGGGCAGMTAALYARRAGKTVLILEGQVIGGQISYSPGVENFPGFKSIGGLEFSDRLMEQATALGAETALETVLSIADDGRIKTVTTDYGVYECGAVIIATGLKHRQMGIDNEEELIGRGISYCAVCDGAFFKGREVVVYGGGNTALQDAVFLSDLCSKVTVIHRRDKFRGDESLVNKLKAKKNIVFQLDSTIKELIGDNQLTAVKTANVKTNAETVINVSGLFVAIGQLPQNEFLNGLIKLDSYGFIDAGEDCMTDKPGIFAAGDCRTKEVRQLITAAADGAVAATAACSYIDSKKQ